jgi:hypothetical protein
MRGARAAAAGLCLVASCLVGCFQEIDSGASSAATSTTLTGPPTHTVDLMTPSIGYGDVSDAQETDDPCTATSFHATAILRAACAPCHGGGPGQNLGQPPFDFVLDVKRLLTAVSSTVKDPVTMQPVRFLVAGDPDHSRLYVRMFKREMPPGDVVGLPPNPNRPTVSDVSVIRQWIGHCLGTNASDGQDDGSGEMKSPAPVDAAAAPALEADAAAAADAGARGDGPSESATPPRAPADAATNDTGVRRRDGGVGARGGG